MRQSRRAFRAGDIAGLQAALAAAAVNGQDDIILLQRGSYDMPSSFALKYYPNAETKDLEISGAQDCGVRIEGASRGALRGNYIHANSGCGVMISGDSYTRLAGNRISANGTVRDAPRRGVEILAPAAPMLDNNVISGNGIRDFGSLPPGYLSEIERRNILEARP